MTIKKVTCLALAILLMLCTFQTALAEIDSDQPSTPDGIESVTPYSSDTFYIVDSNTLRASFILTPSLSISSPSSNTIKVTARANTNIVVDKLGFSSLYIQRWNGSAWVNALSWYNKYKTNSLTFVFSGSTSAATSGAYYRAVCTFYAEKDGETESVTVTTSYIKCK